MDSPVNRRSLLQTIAMGSAGLLVAACANAPSPSPSPSPVPIATGTPIATAVPARAVSPGVTPTAMASVPTVALASATAVLVPATSLPTKPTPAKPAIGLKLGDALPNFTFAGIDGKTITGADLTAQRKPYILFFFATW
jgi:hypothetical protein